MTTRTKVVVIELSSKSPRKPYGRLTGAVRRRAIAEDEGSRDSASRARALATRDCICLRGHDRDHGAYRVVARRRGPSRVWRTYHRCTRARVASRLGTADIAALDC